MAVIFRKLPEYGVNNFHAITVNYFVCFTVGSLILGRPALPTDISDTPWLPTAFFLSFCFILFFNVNALTIQKVGMVITSIFQKLSLIAPVTIGLVFFSEAITSWKIIGIVLTIIAIILVSVKGKTSQNSITEYWYLPILVFFGSGLIECVLFILQEKGMVEEAGLAFSSTLFLLAGSWGVLYILIKQSFPITRNEIAAGVMLGIPNFFTIYLIIKGLELGWEGSVLFPLNNVGVIICTAIIGVIIFKEKLTRLNIIGLFCSLLAVFLLSQ